MHVVFIEGVPLEHGQKPVRCKECKEEAAYKIYIAYRPIGLCRKCFGELATALATMAAITAR